MNPRKGINMGRILASIFIACLIALTGCAANTSRNSQTPLIGSDNAAVIQSAHGLGLSLSLDPATYQTGQDISIVIDEINTLSSTNHIHSSTAIG